MSLSDLQIDWRSIIRIPVAGIVAAVVWFLGLQLVFGPAQGILANPEFQSRKFLEVFTSLEPLPKYAIEPMVFYAGFLVVGLTFSIAYHLIHRLLPGHTSRKGFRFGLLAWLLMIPWFEFYLPWNVMHEPIMLVLFEMILWLIVLQGVSLITAYSYRWLSHRKT